VRSGSPRRRKERRDENEQRRAAVVPRLHAGGMLVVIALIAVLSGFLVPILDGMREEGRRTVCLSHLRQIGQAHLLYLQDWDEHLPEWHMTGPPRPKPFGTLRFWTEYLQPYLRSPAILQDTSAAGRGAPPEGAILADYVLLTWGPGSFGGPDPRLLSLAWPPAVSGPGEATGGDVCADGRLDNNRTNGHSLYIARWRVECQLCRWSRPVAIGHGSLACGYQWTRVLLAALWGCRSMRQLVISTSSL
jgi:hypothetical protein